MQRQTHSPLMFYPHFITKYKHTLFSLLHAGFGKHNVSPFLNKRNPSLFNWNFFLSLPTLFFFNRYTHTQYATLLLSHYTPTHSPSLYPTSIFLSLQQIYTHYPSPSLFHQHTFFYNTPSHSFFLLCARHITLSLSFFLSFTQNWAHDFSNDIFSSKIF